MTLTFLGTGAADWNIANYKDGEEFRRFSSALLDDGLLIDPGPHIFHFAEKNLTPDLYRNVRNIIVTHTHGDHFCSDTVQKLCADGNCILWGDYACRKKLQRDLGDAAEKIPFAETRVGVTYQIGGYAVTPLRANHATEDADETPRLYLIEKDGRTLYYGCDSSWIPTPSWNVIRKRKVNAMVMECTCGETARNDFRIFEHNTLEMLELMLITFRKYGYFADDVKFYTSHMARTLHKSHTELTAYLSPLGVTPAYDGMTVRI